MSAQFQPSRTVKPQLSESPTHSEPNRGPTQVTKRLALGYQSAFSRLCAVRFAKRSGVRVIRDRELCATLQLAIAPEVTLTELDPRKVAVAGAFDDLRRDTMATMSHYSCVLKVVIDAPPELHDQELAFWQGALGQELPEIYSAEYHGAFLRGTGMMLLMQRLESGAPRVHLDIHTDDLDAEVARLERLGAKRVQKVQTWWVMRDPAGLLFCVLPMSPGSLNDENAQRWE